MANDFQSAICSGERWWNQARSASFDMPLSCSAAITDIVAGGEGFSWPTKSSATSDLIETGARSCDESAGSASGSSITFQDSTNKAQSSDPYPSLMQSNAQVPNFGLSSATMDYWTQDLLRSGVKSEGGNFQAMLQEGLNTRSYAPQHEQVQIYPNRIHMGANQNSALEHHHLGNSLDDSGDAAINTSHPFAAASYGRSPTSSQGLLLQPEAKQAIYDQLSTAAAAYRESSNYLLPPSWAEFSQLLKPSPPKLHTSSQLQFSNNTPFWNASAATSASAARPGGLYSPPPPQFVAQVFDPRPLCGNLGTKMNRERVRYSCSSSTKKMSSEPAFKKPRVETPSPLPTFKVRKEKLGDRITALQQLVSPFGKTDTASVLHEAIEYIKFLHDQVGVLSTPYLKNGHPVRAHLGSDKSNDGTVVDGTKKDLKSRGLCLVPVASTYPVAGETSADFWHPTFGATFK